MFSPLSFFLFKKQQPGACWRYFEYKVYLVGQAPPSRLNKLSRAYGSELTRCAATDFTLRRRQNILGSKWTTTCSVLCIALCRYCLSLTQCVTYLMFSGECSAMSTVQMCTAGTVYHTMQCTLVHRCTLHTAQLAVNQTVSGFFNLSSSAGKDWF